MDHRINPGRRLDEGSLKIPGVADVALHMQQPRCGRMPSKLPQTVKRDRVAVAEIIEDQQRVARLQEHHCAMAADEACPTSD